MVKFVDENEYEERDDKKRMMMGYIGITSF